MGKCFYLRIHLLIFLFFYPVVYRLTLTKCKNICTVFFADCFEKHIDRWLFWHCVINIIFQGRNTLHQKVSHIYWRYQYYNSIILYFDVKFCNTIQSKKFAIANKCSTVCVCRIVLQHFTSKYKKIEL